MDIRPFIPTDGPWVSARHGALYAAEEGFDASFEILVAGIVADFVATRQEGRDAGWIGWRDGQRMGSIFVVEEAPGVAKLRLFLLEPEARGTGLAQRMLETALGFARDHGYRKMRLWTHESHAAAGRIYARNGFRLVESEAKRSFGQDVIAQIWERDL